MNDIGIITRQPAFGGRTESDRLRRIYESVEDQPASDWENEGGAVPFKESNITIEDDGVNHG